MYFLPLCLEYIYQIRTHTPNHTQNVNISTDLSIDIMCGSSKQARLFTIVVIITIRNANIVCEFLCNALRTHPYSMYYVLVRSDVFYCMPATSAIAEAK